MTGSPAEIAMLEGLTKLGRPALNLARGYKNENDSRPKAKARRVNLRPGELERIQADYAKGLAPEDMAYKLGRTVGSVNYLLGLLRGRGELPSRPRAKRCKPLAVYHSGGRG